MVFEKELKKLGLKDKEAAVYLSCLELGPSPVQQISRKAKVVRATTYVILESLMDMGLATKYKEGKKTLFVAEPPRQLMRLLEKSREELDEKQHDLEQLLPELQVLTKSAMGQPTVRYFEGLEGLRSIRREMLMYSEPGDTWYSFTPIDHLDAVLHSDQESFYRQRTAKRIKSMTIYLSESPEMTRDILAKYESGFVQQKYVSASDFPIESGLTVYRDRIAIGSFTGKIGGVIIEHETMAGMMRGMFELAWSGIKKS